MLKTTSRRILDAIPSEPSKKTSPWLTVPKEAVEGVKKIVGTSSYKAYAGCCTWLNGVFWIRVLKELPDGCLLIENMHDTGKIKVEHVESSIEPDLVYPLVRGRDVSDWNANPSAYIILTQDPQSRSGIPESVMKRGFPKTYGYLRKFEDQLRGRSGYRQYFDPTDPFWSVYNVGPYSLSQWKVSWAGEVAPRLNAAVVHAQSGKPVICDQTAYFVECSDEEHANFRCAVLNSAPVRCYYGAVAYKHTSMDFIKGLAIPAFDLGTPIHKNLLNFGKLCRRLAAKGTRMKSPSLRPKSTKPLPSSGASRTTN